MKGDPAATFMALARSAPKEALTELQTTVDLVAVQSPAMLSTIYRGAAIASRALSDYPASERYIDKALASALADKNQRAHTEALLTRAGNVLLAGDLEAAIELTSELDGGDDAELTAQINLQLATMYARSGAKDDATAAFDRAESAARTSNSDFLIAMTCKNRGMLRVQEGDCTQASADFVAARDLFNNLSMELEVAFCDHNLALTATYLGDLPRAFNHFASAEDQIRRLTGNDFESKSSHCRALLSAGLFGEAAELARTTARDCHQSGLMLDAAEAQVLESVALLRRGAIGEAATIARSAFEIFQRQQRPGYAASAQHIALVADERAGQQIDADDLRQVTNALSDAGFDREALEARLLLARVVGTADPNDGLDVLSELVGADDQRPAELRLAEATIRATLLRAIGEVDSAAVVAKSGFDVLHAYQATLGSADLRAGVQQYARELGQLGLGLALDDGDPVDVVEWMERVRVAGSLRRSVLPVQDPLFQEALAKLRATGSDDLRMYRLLEEEVRTASRGLGGGDLEAAPVGLTEIFGELGARTAVVFVEHQGMLVAAVLRQGSVVVRSVAQLSEVHRLVRSVRSDLRRRATRPAGGSSARIEATLKKVDSLVLGPLSLTGADDQLVIAAPASLFAIPWVGMPSLAGRPTSVVTSLSNWTRSLPATGSTNEVLIAGPGLDAATTEVRSIAQSRPSAITLTGSEACSAKVLAAMESSSVAHLVCHGTVRTDNPLFSSLELADGPLNVYELDRLINPPDVVVLSACHVGLPSTDLDQELLGMATGLLSTGVGCVVASTLPVPDSMAIVDLMSTFHVKLLAGLSPAEAWASLQREVGPHSLLDTATFCVFGRG